MEKETKPTGYCKRYISITKNKDEEYFIDYHLEFENGSLITLDGSNFNLSKEKLFEEIISINKMVNETTKYTRRTYLRSLKLSLNNREKLNKDALMEIKKGLEGKVRLNLTIFDKNQLTL
jgi:hypothetical protein